MLLYDDSILKRSSAFSDERGFEDALVGALLGSGWNDPGGTHMFDRKDLVSNWENTLFYDSEAIDRLNACPLIRCEVMQVIERIIRQLLIISMFYRLLSSLLQSMFLAVFLMFRLGIDALQRIRRGVRCGVSTSNSSLLPSSPISAGRIHYSKGEMRVWSAKQNAQIPFVIITSSGLRFTKKGPSVK